MSKHSPPRWEIIRGEKNCITIRARKRAGFTADIATIYEDDGEMLANAHLLRAAPEMYDRLRSIYVWLYVRIQNGDRISHEELKEKLKSVKATLDAAEE